MAAMLEKSRQSALRNAIRACDFECSLNSGISSRKNFRYSFRESMETLFLERREEGHILNNN
jgi:hypothetical protein